MPVAAEHKPAPQEPESQSIQTPPAAAIKRNQITTEYRDGRWVMVKRRTLVGQVVALAANAYFRAAGIAIRFWTKPRDWQRWEMQSFRMLNRRFACVAPREGEVQQERLEGKSLWVHLRDGTLTDQMIQSAARAYRHAHEMHSDYFDGPWSHGDASMSNVIYDPRTGESRLIDFELVHDRSLSAAARQADDLLVFLLDLAGFVPRKRWLPLAILFLQTYGRKEPVAELQNRLTPPRGIGRIWWKIRTNFKSSIKIRRRLSRLRRALAHGAVRSA